MSVVHQDQAVPVALVAALQEALAVVVQAAAIHPVVPDQVQAPAPVGEKRKLKVSRGLGKIPSRVSTAASSIFVIHLFIFFLECCEIEIWSLFLQAL